MLKIEILLRNSNLTLAVHRKSEIDANLLFEQILAAIGASNSEGKPQLLQLTCDCPKGAARSDRHPKTKIAVLNRNVAAVSLADG